jgi:hypothetical protein
MCTKVLIGKSLQLEKTDTAKSKNNIGKDFCSPARPGSFAACTLNSDAGNTYICSILYVKMTLKLKISILRLYSIGTLYISTETISRLPQSHETIPLTPVIFQSLNFAY